MRRRAAKSLARPAVCRARLNRQPCAPLNHEIRRAPSGEVISDRWFCSCGRTMRRSNMPPPSIEKER